MNAMKVILASESPHKREVLRHTGLDFEVVPSNYEEDMTRKVPPEELALALALGKARVVAAQHPNAIVIGTDVFVTFEGKMIGKPKSKTEAKTILTRYRGKEVDVICGLAVIKGRQELTHVEKSGIVVRADVTEKEIDAYIASGEPSRSGGAFTHNYLGANIIERTYGDYTATIGLPLYITLKFLRAFGVNPLCQP